MKRTMRITETKEFEIDIPDENITEEFLKDFGECIGYNHRGADSKLDEIFDSVAYQVKSGDISTFVEGVGKMCMTMSAKYHEDIVGTYNLLYEDVEIEVME